MSILNNVTFLNRELHRNTKKTWEGEFLHNLLTCIRMLVGVEKKAKEYYKSLNIMELRQDALLMSLRLISEDIETAITKAEEEKRAVDAAIEAVNGKIVQDEIFGEMIEVRLDPIQ